MWGRHGDSTAHGPGRLLLESDSDLETVLLGPESFKTLTRPWEPPRAGRAGGGGGPGAHRGSLRGRGWPAPSVWLLHALSSLSPQGRVPNPRAVFQLVPPLWVQGARGRVFAAVTAPA